MKHIITLIALTFLLSCTNKEDPKNVAENFLINMRNQDYASAAELVCLQGETSQHKVREAWTGESGYSIEGELKEIEDGLKNMSFHPPIPKNPIVVVTYTNYNTYFDVTNWSPGTRVPLVYKEDGWCILP